MGVRHAVAFTLIAIGYAAPSASNHRIFRTAGRVIGPWL